MQHPNSETVTLNDILLTEELSRRAPRPPNWQVEAEAMRAIAQQMAQDSESLMQTLVDTALKLCQAGTTGLSLLETTSDGEDIFRWNVLSGTLAHHVGGSTPRNFSPCGVCLEQGSPVLFSHPERYFTYFQDANTPIVEGLVLPLMANSYVFGTIWIMSHDQERHFDAEDVRVMTSLADFTATALLLQQRQTGELLAANAALETEIVDRKQAEDALRESEEKYRSLFNLIDEGFCVIEVLFDESGNAFDYRFLEANPAFEQQTGLVDAIGKTMRELVPQHEAHWFEIYGRIARTGIPERFENVAEELGRFYDVYAFRMGEPRERKVAILFNNISDRKRQEEALHESEERLRDVLNSMTEGFALLGNDFTILDVNEETLRLDGRSRDELIGCSHWDAFPGTEDSSVSETFRHVVRERMSTSLEHVYCWSDGRSLWLDMRAYPTRNDGVAIFWRDVTDRKQAEAALRESEEKYRSLFETMDEGYLLSEVIFDENDKPIDIFYLEANPAAVRLAGRDFSGRRMREIDPNYEEYWYEIYGHVALTGESVRAERYAQPHDRWFDFYAFKVGGQESRRVAAVFNDITDRKRFEQRQAYMLQLSDALRSLADPLVVQEVACRVLGEHLEANRVLYSEMFEDLGSQTLIRVSDYTAGVPSRVGWHRLEDYGEFVMETWQAGRNLLWSSLDDLPNLSADERAAYEAVEIEAIIGVPLVKEGRFEAFLAVHQATPRKWTTDEIALVEETAERTWAAVERARAEMSLHASEAKYRSLFNSIDNGFCIIERVPGEQIDFRYLEANPAFAVQTGISDVVGKTIREVVPGVSEGIYEIYENVLQTGEPIRSEIDVSSLDRILEIYVFRIEDEPRLAVIFKDITDRKRREANLTFLANLMNDFAPLATAEEVMEMAGKRITEHLDLSRYMFVEIFPEAGTCTYLFPSHPPGQLEISGSFVLAEYHTEEEHRLLCAGHSMIVNDVRDGTRTPEQIALFEMFDIGSIVNTPYLSNGRWVFDLGVARSKPSVWREDEIELLREISARVWLRIERARAEAELRESEIERVREQSALEQERQRAETLAELDRAKTSFFSNISHEFRTPLTLSLAPLQDALESVDEWMGRSVDENPSTHRPIDLSAIKHNLELAHRNSLRLLKLVNTLLDFSRIEAGRMEAVYEPTDLATFTTELTSVFRSAIERAGLQLIVNCPPLPEPVFVDREMWEKIVLNLLSNAFKFTFEGEIRVSLYSTDCNQAILQVQDTGSGIAPEHLPHLFERFYQVRSTQARTHEGSGIGLALVHELVRLHGGTIEVSSILGEGTCFTITLTFGTAHLPSDRLHLEGDRPSVRTLASTAMRATVYVEEAERWLSEETGQEAFSFTPDSLLYTLPSARVLVVDDNADMREYLNRILSEHVQVEVVADGATALAVAQAQVPDLILSDVMMPGLDGFELLGALRADPRTREIPIILLSARAGEEAIVEGLEAGADDYLIKPFSAQELVSRVTAHLQMAQLRGEALQEARSTLRSRDEFISVVSHELNTPLVSILGWTRMLRSSPPNPVMLSKALDTIERNATLQGKLVQDLLDISRITAGKLRLNPQPIELKPVIETAIATITQPAADKGIHLTWQETVAEPVIMMGDSDRLSQVLINLLTNAIKFTPESGSVTLKLSVVNDDGSADASYAEVRITDTGIGIAADFLPHVFDRFRQAEGAHSVKGLGLGLAITRHIVELHNGTIHADSAGEGHGATFTVRLPLLQDSES